jgi:hypothetical protein
LKRLHSEKTRYKARGPSTRDRETCNGEERTDDALPDTRNHTTTDKDIFHVFNFLSFVELWKKFKPGHEADAALVPSREEVERKKPGRRFVAGPAFRTRITITC